MSIHEDRWLSVGLAQNRELRASNKSLLQTRVISMKEKNPELTCAQIGECFGIPPERVQRILSQAKRRLLASGRAMPHSVCCPTCGRRVRAVDVLVGLSDGCGKRYESPAPHAKPDGTQCQSGIQTATQGERQ